MVLEGSDPFRTAFVPESMQCDTEQNQLSPVSFLQQLCLRTEQPCPSGSRLGKSAELWCRSLLPLHSLQSNRKNPNQSIYSKSLNPMAEIPLERFSISGDMTPQSVAALKEHH